ncbi:MAG: hypothetical protein QGG20_03425 [Dehalococcoidia bacterium]|nr:hypothetical protein [Dehalococcoidia bacterium]
MRAARESTKFNYGARLRAPKKAATQGGRLTADSDHRGGLDLRPWPDANRPRPAGRGR